MLGLLEVLLVADEGVEAGVVGQPGELAVGQGHVVDVDVVHAGLDLLDARQVVDVADPARPVPADQMILLGVHHVDVLAGDQLGLGDRVVLARHQLVLDVLVIELLEDVDVLGDDLRVVLPADEMQRFGRRRRSACGSSRARPARRPPRRRLAALRDGAAGTDSSVVACASRRAPSRPSLARLFGVSAIASQASGSTPSRPAVRRFPSADGKHEAGARETEKLGWVTIAPGVYAGRPRADARAPVAGSVRRALRDPSSPVEDVRSLPEGQAGRILSRAPEPARAAGCRSPFRS